LIVWYIEEEEAEKETSFVLIHKTNTLLIIDTVKFSLNQIIYKIRVYQSNWFSASSKILVLFQVHFCSFDENELIRDSFGKLFKLRYNLTRKENINSNLKTFMNKYY